MARQKGIIRVKGTLLDLNFYESRGEDLVRTSGGGFTSDSSKKYPRIKENITEFSAASTANKVFKQSIHSLTVPYDDGTLHSRLQSFFMSIKDLDAISGRGQRRVANGIMTPYGKRLLQEFDFTPKRSVLLNGRLDFDWDTFRLTISGFDIQNAGIPKNADVMGLRLLTVRFDFETLTYVKEASVFLELYRDFGDDHFSMQTPPLTDGNGLRFALLQVAFYQQVGGVNYILAGDGKFGLGIVGVE